jgi:hypothetical protein
MKRETNTAVVWRKIPDQLITNTIYGTTAVRSKFCPACHTTRSLSSFYLRSPDHTKVKPYNVLDPSERLCVGCRDEQTRKRRKSQNEKNASATLDRFF